MNIGNYKKNIFGGIYLDDYFSTKIIINPPLSRLTRISKMILYTIFVGLLGIMIFSIDILLKEFSNNTFAIMLVEIPFVLIILFFYFLAILKLYNNKIIHYIVEQLPHNENSGIINYQTKL